jgi:predicted DNA binding CopG/RHH family protein
MNKRLKLIPAFAPEAEERKFWETHDSADYVDWSKAKRAVLPNLKPTTNTISLRLPQHLLDAIKAAANARDVPYQSLIKVWLQEKVESQCALGGKLRTPWALEGPDSFDSID